MTSVEELHFNIRFILKNKACFAAALPPGFAALHRTTPLPSQPHRHPTSGTLPVLDQHRKQALLRRQEERGKQQQEQWVCGGDGACY